MLNDKKASELISKSLRQELSAEEQAIVEGHLAENKQLQAFQRISSMIQNSVADIGVLAIEGDESISPGLSADAKQRLRKSVVSASQRLSLAHDHLAESADAAVTSQTELAVRLIENQSISEERLAKLVEDWNPDEQGELGDYLVRQGVIDEQELSKAFGLFKKHDSTIRSDHCLSDIKGSAALSRIEAISKSSGRQQRSSDSRHVVSRFKLIRKLGEGGLGAVWLARDEKLKRNVAIKEVHSESLKASQRFHREAQITGFLEHPNVVPLYQFGSDPKSGQPFYAMRFVGKRTLHDAIIEYHEKRKTGIDEPVDLRRLLSAFLDVCQAIGYAHSRGVIHRDLKPENVALDSFGQVIVLDWGLAKLTNEGELVTQLKLGPAEDDPVISRTLDGEVVGTPLYMAPEQALGQQDRVDERTDIYGLGAILFAILTGLAPHENSLTLKPASKPIRELLKEIAVQDPPTPRQYNSGISADLETICVRAMSNKPYARYPNASELADEIEQWLAGQTEKQQQYEKMRMEGRELLAHLQSAVDDIMTNTRFMAKLPPIQEIIDLRNGTTQDDEATWRERLSVIYRGLLQANRDYSAVGFCALDNGQANEIVRVERHSTDPGNIRSVPLSRLTKCDANEFEKSVLLQKPDEVFVMPIIDSAEDEFDVSARKLRGGVPVYDQRTEEPFGFVWIECRLHEIFESRLRNRVRTASQLYAVDDETRIWIHESRDAGFILESMGRLASEIFPAQAIVQCLARKPEFVCEQDRDYYATRLQLGRRNAALYLILSRIAYTESHQ